MTILTVQLVFDCADPDEIMRFWGRAAGYTNEQVAMEPDELREWRTSFPQFDGRGRVDDAAGKRTPIYIQKVPEAKSGRNRIRPEIAVQDFSELGRMCRVEAGDELSDVESNEFTALEVAGEPHIHTIVFDALEPPRQLEFWTRATGYVADGNRCDPPSGSRRWDDGMLVVDDVPTVKHLLYANAPDGEAFALAAGLAFVGTDRPKTVKNRLHVDLWTTDAEHHRDRLIELGATVRQWDTEHVMLDPEGNEFCVS